MAAVYKNNLEIVDLMIAAGTNVNLPDKDGLTPLVHIKNRRFFNIIRNSTLTYTNFQERCMMSRLVEEFLRESILGDKELAQEILDILESSGGGENDDDDDYSYADLTDEIVDLLMENKWSRKKANSLAGDIQSWSETEFMPAYAGYGCEEENLNRIEKLIRNTKFMTGSKAEFSKKIQRINAIIPSRIPDHL